jgi:hypothetical protein
MKTSDAFLTLSKIIQDSQFVINASLSSDSNELLKFDLELFSNENGYISLKFHVFINQTILAEKVIQNGGVVIPNTEIHDITEFIIRRNIEILPYLKEYNKDATNYDKLAELYYVSRGSIVGKRFGF